MSRTILPALAAATSTFSRGASSTHKPSCSFQSISQTYFLHFGHLWKCPFASFWAVSNAASCSLCHSGDIPRNFSAYASAPRSTPQPTFDPKKELPIEAALPKPRKKPAFLRDLDSINFVL